MSELEMTFIVMASYINYILAVIVFIVGLGNIPHALKQIPHIKAHSNRIGNVSTLVKCIFSFLFCTAISIFLFWSAYNYGKL